MILTIKNSQDFITAYLVFIVLNDEDKMDDNGKYLFINGFWIHPSLRKTKFRSILRIFIDEIIKHPTTQKIEEVYWERDSGKVCRYLASRFIRYRCSKLNNNGE